VMNISDKEKEIDFSKYAERTAGFTTATNVITNSVHKLSDKVSIPSKQLWVLELK